MKTISTLLLTGLATAAMAQNYPFFETTTYVGALSSDVSQDWTKGWTNFNPQNASYPSTTDNSTLDASGSGKLEISNTLVLDPSKVYLLKGIVVVKSGGLLRIPAGTVIRAQADLNASPKNYASILVERGGQIEVNGTATNPVVITSNMAAGSRYRGDWGGLIICGKATNNQGSDVQVEGFNNVAFDNTLALHGGASPLDNSGKISYLRLEFGGLAFESNKEINGLTLGSVGRLTTIEGVQISFSGDDGFEWFGGNVNAKKLISYKNTDDDFDTDFGYSGAVQFGIAVRDTSMYDLTYGAPSGASTSETFESDNDAGGSGKTPYTSAVFSNITAIGPVAIGKTYGDLASVHKAAFRRGARIRRNSRLSIVNSIFMGYRNFVMFDGDSTLTAAGVVANAFPTSMLFRNNLIVNSAAAFTPASSTANGLVEVASSNSSFLTGFDTWLKASTNANNINPVAYSAGTVLVDPQGSTPDWRPVSGSPALSGSNHSYGIMAPYLSSTREIATVGSLNLYPNPSNGTISIQMELMATTTLKFNLLDRQGRLVKSLGSQTSAAGTQNASFDVSELNNGLYFLEMSTGNARITEKLFINK